MAGVRLEFAQFGHFDYFKIYRNSVSTAIENLGEPIGSSSTMYYEDLTVESNQDYYYRAGVVRNSIEEFSGEFHVKTVVEFDPPYNLIVEFKNDETNRLELNWNLDGFIDEQRYYCAETSIDPINLPAPKIVLQSDVRTYVDTNIELGKTYHVCVSSVRGGTEKLSQFITMYAFNQSLFKINSDFESNLTDKTSKVWTAVGTANVSDGRLNLDGTGDYLTTPESNDYHFNNSEDVTIRFKVKINSFKASNIATVFSTFRPNAGNPNYSVRVLNDRIAVVMWSAQTPIWTYSIPLGIEKEISIERESMIWRLYVDGVQIGSTFTQTSNYTKYIATAYLGSGIYESYGSDRDLNGTIRKFQIIKGLAVGVGQSTTPRI